jgi:hypothetical protein
VWTADGNRHKAVHHIAAYVVVHVYDVAENEIKQVGERDHNHAQGDEQQIPFAIPQPQFIC